MKKNIEVFDFKEEDELAEFAAEKLLEKFRNPNPGGSLILERQCIRNFFQGSSIQKGELGNASCMDADVEACNSREDSPNFTAEAEDSRLGPACQLNLEAHEEENGVNQVNHGSGNLSFEAGSKKFFGETPSPGRCQLNSSLSDPPSSQERVDMMSADDESLSDCSTSSPASNSAEDSDLLKDWKVELCFGAADKIDINTAVIMSPDYVVIQDRPCTEALVIFSCHGVIINGRSANDEEGSFSYEWRVEDIIDMQHHWFQNVGLVILELRVLLKDEIYNKNMQSNADVEELKFAITEHSWPEKQQRISLLNVKYSDVWRPGLDGQVTGDNLSQQSRYFPSFDEPFEDVIYPKGDPDAVSICKRDVDLLQPETFVNDTIIDFYIKYLKNQIQPEENHRFHFFNSFFFRKLADLDKDPSSIADGKVAFLRVRKWTRKVDIFGKDYIFIPVNFNLHWSLIVICHPGEVADYTDVDLDKSVRVPCILHMDSIRGSHAGLKNLVQSYLCEEWKERHKETSDDVSSKFLNLRFVSLELPQQENSFDCGLFLLHYLELFLVEAPRDFNPFKISNVSNFLYADWFPPAEASLKRTLIQKLIFKLLETRDVVGSEDNESSESPLDNEKGTGIEVLAERCSTSAASHRNLPESQDGQGIEMTLLERSSMKNLQGTNDSGIVLRELFDPGVASGSLLGQLQPLEESSPFYHLNNDISPREQVETREQFICLNSVESNFQRISEMAASRGSTSFSHGGFGAESSWNLGISVHMEHRVDASSSERLTSASDDSDEIGIIEAGTVEMTSRNPDKETGEGRVRNTVSPSTLPEEISTVSEGVPTVAVLNADRENDSDDKGEPCPPKDNPVVLSGQDVRADETHLADDIEIAGNTSETLGNDGNCHLVMEAHEEKEEVSTVFISNADQENSSDDKERCPPKDNLMVPSGQDVRADVNPLADDIEMANNTSDNVVNDGYCRLVMEAHKEKEEASTVAILNTDRESGSNDKETCAPKDNHMVLSGQDVRADENRSADDIEMAGNTSDNVVNDRNCPPLMEAHEEKGEEEEQAAKRRRLSHPKDTGDMEC